MVQQSSNLHHSSAEFNHDNARSPLLSRRRPASDPRETVRARAIHEVVVLEPTGPFSDLVEDLDLAIQLALADGPRGVVCDLSDVPRGAEPGAVAWLAMAGRLVRDWPGIPVAVACPDPRVREALSAHPLGRHLIVTASVPLAISAVLATATPVIEWLRLAPHPTAPRASRNFMTRTVLSWGLGPLAPSVCLVISELVTNSTMYAGSNIVISVAWSMGALRLTVRDLSPDLPRPRKSRLGLHGRGLTIVTGFTKGFGVLPTAEGGEVVWAVFDAPEATPRPVLAVQSRSTLKEAATCQPI